MPSEAFRNRHNLRDINAAIGPPSSETEQLRMVQCIQELVIRLLDLKQPHVQFRVATICLALPAAPATTVEIARLLYQLSKDAGNDQLFAEALLLPLMVKHIRQACDCQDRIKHEVAVLLTTALKNATTDTENRQLLVAADGALVLSYILRSEAVQAASSRHPGRKAAGTLAVQALGVLRNLAASRTLLPELRKADVLKGLRGALTLAGSSKEVAFGVARILCKLTLDNSMVMGALAQPDLLKVLVKCARQHLDQPSTTLRFTYAFGNLVAQSQENAISFFGVRSHLFLWAAAFPTQHSRKDITSGCLGMVSRH
jgi:hypothetical protein